MTLWTPSAPSTFARRTVGLFGGSFNPAHDGHRHIALAALAGLGLDEIWWLVSPQNPLKADDGMLPLADRLASAARMARHPAMRATALEAGLGTSYTADTLARIKALYPRNRFVWIMGADNLVQIPRWKDWSSIFNAIPVAVFARPSYSARALSGAAAQRFARRRVPENRARRLARCAPPAWTFIHCRLHDASASAIRAGTAASPEAAFPAET
ncbi:MAG: nicotinate-nucleotide adenylyltransferase [Rhodospirillaceae bacterium]|nr:nicotinate-nucleotide adenylyltransferase [Rhodospirillaceae bacterium]MYB14234.1 nicotinate-nucleotide adenylyltransferase [Rhodospirillaceae bacterium]MYI49298.1 nicotinate-nucleotide adenylyltransferase [Rhodospirillaceae bacterium]